MRTPLFIALPALGLLAACAVNPDRLDAPQGKAFERIVTNAPGVASIEHYEVLLPAREHLRYGNQFSGGFGAYLPYAPGSGLSYRSTEADGRLLFWGLGDRGPNGDSPKVEIKGKAQASKVFLTPDFVPRIAEIRLTPGQHARVTRTIPLSYDGLSASGLPLAPGNTGATGEVALDDRLQPLAYSPRGIDPEAIATDRAGNFWLADEYGPFIVKTTPRGQVLLQYAPGKGLPEILAARQPNRGFEGLAITPAGKIYAAVQSTLDVDGKTKNLARFIRIVELDPVSGATRQFAYPLDLDDYKRAGDVKLGDLVAIDDSHFALIDQGEGKRGTRNVIYVIDIAGADDISARLSASGKALEYASAAELASLKFIRKQRVLDLRELGWKPEKAEGLALIPGGFAVINDNDFGLKSEISGDKGADMGAYAVRDGQLNHQGRYSLKPSQEATQLWLIRLNKPLQNWFSR
ncbi:esterase-like activity of phytase family protein [Uliginosibacterium flavum]|uniref:Esterase-like activity of phytase family protein n=1 Tax=Uliginosibacterium flavum TaxID=1396831 RepID=A0ABV2TGR2_9RHOO